MALTVRENEVKMETKNTASEYVNLLGAAGDSPWESKRWY